MSFLKTLEIKTYAFRSGYNQLALKDVDAATADLMSALNLTTKHNFFRRVNGEVVPKVTEVIEIEKVFKKYGITKNIWGEE